MTKKKIKSERVDILLVNQGFADSTEKAQRLIRAGLVTSENQKLDKPGVKIPIDTILSVKGSECPYVSRGGMKLAGALREFGVNPIGQVCLDLGSSTGGFTDCLLQHGAEKVYAIDVGTAQLHHNLLNHDRVISREKTHMNDLQPTDFSPAPTFAVADLSFISLRRSYPVLKRVMAPGSQAILLVKPQFEVPKELLPKGGVLEDQALQLKVLADLSLAAKEEGFEVSGTCLSPLKGGDGNQEFFLWLML